jgi:hypothetical protein
VRVDRDEAQILREQRNNAVVIKRAVLIKYSDIVTPPSKYAPLFNGRLTNRSKTINKKPENNFPLIIEAGGCKVIRSRSKDLFSFSDVIESEENIGVMNSIDINCTNIMA